LRDLDILAIVLAASGSPIALLRTHALNASMASRLATSSRRTRKNAPRRAIFSWRAAMRLITHFSTWSIRTSNAMACGLPVHNRGVSAVPGLYFLGLPWLSKMNSSFLAGVGDDATHLADQIAARGVEASDRRDRFCSSDARQLAR